MGLPKADPASWDNSEPSQPLARHDQHRLHLEAVVIWPIPFNIVVFVYIHDFLSTCYHPDRHIVVSPVFQNYETPVDSFEN